MVKVLLLANTYNWSRSFFAQTLTTFVLREEKLNANSNPLSSFHGILGLQPRDKAAMLVVNTKEIFVLNLHQNRVHFPAERNAFVLDHQHGRRDVTCKPSICSDHICNICDS